MKRDFEVTGTHIWYYFICRREVWLIAHQIAADQENQSLALGRFVDETSYQKLKQDISLGYMRIDRLYKKGDRLFVGEVKKSSTYEKSATMQLLFYLDQLRQAGIDAQGELLFPLEKKRLSVEWTEALKAELEEAITDILSIVYEDWPPNVEKKKYCFKCAYREYCWAEEEE